MKTPILALTAATLSLSLTACGGGGDKQKATAKETTSVTPTPTPPPTSTPTPALADTDGDGTYDVDDEYPTDPQRVTEPWGFKASDYEHGDVLAVLHKAGYDEFIRNASDADSSVNAICETISGKKPGGGTERDLRDGWMPVLTGTDDTSYGWSAAKANKFLDTLFAACRSTGNSDPYVPPLTASQEQAIGKAEDYLDYSHFSKQSLIEQLEYEGFSTEDAEFAVENVSVDWRAQAVGKAKEYLDYSHFSRQGLIEQLEYEGFSPENAEYAATKAGL